MLKGERKRTSFDVGDVDQWYVAGLGRKLSTADCTTKKGLNDTCGKKEVRDGIGMK
jgi:hypothetical protein